MCIIIDADFSHRVVNHAANQNIKPILDYLDSQQGCLALGGQVTTELIRNNKVRSYIVSLERAGRVKKYPKTIVDEEKRNVVTMGICVSNDPHIIALARLSRARVLCSNDRALHTDFQNRSLIDNPRGNIYQDRTHQHLLRNACPCREP